jgi:hypothetical protein
MERPSQILAMRAPGSDWMGLADDKRSEPPWRSSAPTSWSRLSSGASPFHRNFLLTKG